MLCNSCHFIPLKPLTLRIDNAKLLDVLTSLPVSHAILPRACVLQCHFRQTMQYVVNDNVNNVKLSYDVISMSRYLMLQFSSRQFFGLTGVTG